MQLVTKLHQLEFTPVDLHFYDTVETNVFAKKNNKTVAETIQDRRYAALAATVQRDYGNALHLPLGEFLLGLKLQNDGFYLRFLNPYGDDTFCWFSIKDAMVSKQKGLYIYTVDHQVQYIGRCQDSFRKRINQGYGRISPKNCYLDGRATNCRLNALIAQHRTSVAFYVSPLVDPMAIVELERHFIQDKRPLWNIALNRLP